MKLIRRFSRLNKTIEGYGYEYSPKKLLAFSLVLLVCSILMGYYYRLNYLSIAALSVFTILLFPSIINAQFRLLSNNDSFEQLSNYMDHMIISFKKNPKILSSMETAYCLVEGKMQRCIGMAIDSIRNDNSDKVYENAFALIESEFPTSRLRTMHRFMLNVEKENSISYQSNIDTLYYDIHNWVTRIYSFQQRIKSAKQSITVSIVISLAIIAYFCQTLAKVSDSVRNTDITSGSFYQFETLVFLMILTGLYVLVHSKLNGIWLVDDLSTKDDEAILEVIRKYDEYDPVKGRRQSIIRSIPFMAFAGFSIYAGSRMLLLLSVMLLAIFITGSSRLQEGRKRRVKKELLKEFPAWLRDVSVNLHNMVGVNAVLRSYDNAPAVMKPFIEQFADRVEKDPVSIAPYDGFFGEFRVPELAASVKTIYSLQSQSREEAQRQVNDLTERNQELIARSEELRLKDTISGISFLAAVPMLAMTGKLMCDMIIVLLQILTAL